MIVDGVSSAMFWLRPIGQVAIVEGNREKERCEECSDTNNFYDFGSVFHLSVARWTPAETAQNKANRKRAGQKQDGITRVS